MQRTLATAGVMAAVLAGAACSAPDLAASAPGLTPASGHVIADPHVTFEGVTVMAGDRVEIRKRAGTFKPGDTGHHAEVEAGPGRTGLALGGVARDPAYARPGEPLQLVLVRFDAQAWPAEGGETQLDAFEALIHAEHLRVVR